MARIKVRGTSYNFSNTQDILRFITQMEDIIATARSFLPHLAHDPVYDIGFTEAQFRDILLGMGFSFRLTGQLTGRLFAATDIYPEGRSVIYIGDLAAIWGYIKGQQASHEKYGEPCFPLFNTEGYYGSRFFRSRIKGFGNTSMRAVLKVLETYKVQPNSTPKDWKPPIP